MRGYILPIILALLLAAPMLWRLDSGVSAGLKDPQTARVVFEEMPQSEMPLREMAAGNRSASGEIELFSAIPATDDRLADLLPVLPASEKAGAEINQPLLVVLPEARDRD